jgi:2-polyprenyl-3-methyl-5-hydroxy-6-metoxy-1,4-benzoquinol methylase
MKKSVVEKHFDKVADDYDYYKNKNSFYYENLKKLLNNLIPKNMKVFEVGCGTGDLLVHLKPKFGYGMDISGEMISIAKSKHKSQKQLTFSTVWPKEKFDFIFMSDVIEHLENPKETFSKILNLMGKDSIFINTMANPVWEPVLVVAERLGLKMPEGPHNRIKNHELRIMMEKAGLNIIKHDRKLLVPVYIPFVTDLINKYLETSLKKLAFIEYFVTVKA